MQLSSILLEQLSRQNHLRERVAFDDQEAGARSRMQEPPIEGPSAWLSRALLWSFSCPAPAVCLLNTKATRLRRWF